MSRSLLTLVTLQQYPLLFPRIGLPLLALIPTLLACYAYLPSSFNTRYILPYVLSYLLITCAIENSLRSASEFGVFPSVLLHDSHDTDVGLPTCVPAGLPKVHSFSPIWPHQTLLVPYVLYPLVHYSCYFGGLAAVLIRKSGYLLQISLFLHL